jgi:hypothetical protein
MPLCKNPYMVGPIPAPCGQCHPCTVNRKRLWQHRILLESYSHENTAFVTLTYDDENLVFQNEKTGEFTHPTLAPSHITNFLKRLRRAIDPKRIRYYAVGEYGDRSWRPHYHLAIFGYEPCWYGQTRKDRHAQGKSCCPPCDLLLKTWGKGGIDNASIEDASAGYIAGYVTKKLTKKDDPRLDGRLPEFSRMSRKPGIGALQIENIGDALFTEFGKDALTEHGDVPISLTHGNKSLPLGKYLRDKLRDEIGVNDATKEKAKEAYQTELLAMWADYLNDPEIPEEKKLSLKKHIQDRDHQKILNMETKHNIKKRSKLL